MPVLLGFIDGQALWQTIWTGAVAGIGVCIIFAFTILGAARSTDMRLEDRAVAATLYAVLAVLGTLASFAVVIYAVVLITTK
ncbi:hypothetical protein DSM112329_03177 [Paraconexibacter sp. AEG42_29]|uniref:Uncharacterized protein n=1 Tax=Paraconexibacter sp. AEG42_29 TaxID=2997339 RepID=A0AAU7AX58_9ACTN